MATEIGRLVAVIDGDISGLQRAIAGAQKNLQNAGASMTRAGQSLTMGLTLPIVGIGAIAAKASIDFESAFAGVRKTVDATAEQLDKLRTGIRGMAKEMPASAVEIAKVAEAAGQLGIRTENILEFTRVMVMLGETTNLTANDAATALARIANIMQLPQDEFEKLGATLVDLGNKGASTEAEIVEMALRIAGAGTQVGLSADQVLAFANALSSVGIEAQAGGSAISRAFIEIANAAASGGDELDEFARIAGMSAEEFAKAFRDDAASAMVAFMEGLDRISISGENVFEVLDGLGLGEIRVRDALLRAANAGDLFAQSLRDGKQAWQEGTALSVEYGKRVETTAAKLEILKNRLNDTMITLGDALVPVLIDVLEASKPIISAIEFMATGFANLPRPVQMVIVAIAALLAVIGPLLIAIGLMASGVSALIGVLVALGIVGPAATFSITGLAASFGALTLAAAPWLVLALAIGAGLYLLIKNWDEVTAAVSRAASMIRDVAVGAFNTVLSFLRSNWPEVATLIAGPFAPLVALATDAFGVRSATIAAFREIIEFLRGVPGEIANAFGNLGDLLYNVGKALVTGLWRGMSDVAAKMISWVGDLAKKIAGVFNKALGIFSPSKVMFKVGLQTMAGLGSGLSSGWESYVDPVLGKTIKEVNAMSDEWRMANFDAIANLGKQFGFTVFEDASIASPDTKAYQNNLGNLPHTSTMSDEELKRAAADLRAKYAEATSDVERLAIRDALDSVLRQIAINEDKIAKSAKKAGGYILSAAGEASNAFGETNESALGLGETIAAIGPIATKATRAMGDAAKMTSAQINAMSDDWRLAHKEMVKTVAEAEGMAVAEDWSIVPKSFYDKIDFTPVTKLKKSIAEIKPVAENSSESVEDLQYTAAADWTAPSIDDLVSDIDEVGSIAEKQIPSLEAAGFSGRNAFQEIGHAARGFGSIIGSAFKSLNNVDLGVDEWLGRAFKNAFKFLESVNLGDRLVSALGSLNDVDLGVDEWIGRAFENAKTAAGSGIESLISFIGTNFTAENLGRATAWLVLWPVEAFQQAFDAVGPVVSNFFGSTLPTFFLQTLPELQASAQAIGVSIINGIASGISLGALTAFTFFTTTLPNTLLNTAISVQTGAQSIGVSIINGIASGLSSAAVAVQNFFLMTLPGFISGAVTSVHGAAMSLGKSIIEGIGRGVVDAWETIRVIPGDIVKAIGDAFDAYENFWIGIGKAIVSGISKGISDLAGEVAKKFGEFLGGLVDQANKILKWPHSPSRVFVDLGQSIVEGLAKGLEGMQDIDTGLSSLIDNAQRTIASASMRNFTQPQMPQGLWKNIVQPIAAGPGQGGLTIQAYDTVVNNYDEMQDVDKAIADLAFAAAAQLRYRGYP